MPEDYSQTANGLFTDGTNGPPTDQDEAEGQYKRWLTGGKSTESNGCVLENDCLATKVEDEEVVKKENDNAIMVANSFAALATMILILV